MKNLLNPNVNQFPFWQNPGLQIAYFIPGSQVAGEIQDIQINKIPSETDFNNNDLGSIPVPLAPAHDITSAQGLETHTAEMGRGASVSLIDMFNMSMDEIKKIGGNTL